MTTQFRISRTFDAPRDLVWKVHSEAAHLAQWWGPAGFTWIKSSLDFRPGGRFHYAMKAPTGAVMWGKFDYREIEPPERIVFTNSFSDEHGNTVRAPFAPDFPLEVLNVLTFEDKAGKTVLTLSGEPINATEAELKRYAAMHPSMNQGFSGTFDQLDRYLAKLHSGEKS
jgi:uncharacterized protein YndB with AHSA1/START domain